MRRPRIANRVAALTAYLKGAAGEQPLQNRRELLWTARKLPGVTKREWIDEALRQQSADGGVDQRSARSLEGHKTAVPSPGATATLPAFATFRAVGGRS